MVNSKDNVIPLKAAKPSTAPPKLRNKQALDEPVHKPVSQLPRGIQAVHLLLSKVLQQGMSQFFNQSDDALFERAEIAGNNQEQSQYFEAMRALRMSKATLAQSLFETLRNSFVELQRTSSTQPGTLSVYDNEDLCADDVQLVSEEAFEEEVAIKSMVTAHRQQHQQNLDHLWRRCFHLLGKKGEDNANRLPCDVEKLTQCFAGQLDALSVAISIKLLLLKIFERSVLQQLGNAYALLNQRMAEQGVLPDLQRQISRERRAKLNTRRTRVRHDTQVQGHALGDLHQLMDDDTSLIPTLNNKIEESSLSTQQLGQILAGFQGQQASMALQTQEDSRALSEKLSQLLMSQGHVSQLDRNIINLVHMLFEYIWEDPNLAAPMRAVLSRMQIPLLKVALADAAFLQAGSHPARQLLNEMARCALGWEEPEDAERRKQDALLQQLEMIVQRVQDEFVDDVSIFTELHQQLRKFLDREQRRAELVAQRTVDQVRGEALTTQAKAAVSDVLNKACEGLPGVGQALLREAWARVLQMVYLKQGADSVAWSEKLDMAEQLATLLRNCTQSNSEAELALLVQKMEGDLADVGLDSFQSRAWFEAVENHVREQRPRRDVSADLDFACAENAESGILLAEDDVSLNPEAPSSEASEAPEETQEEHVVARESLSPGDPAMRQARRLSQGAWLQWVEDGNSQRCRLAAILPSVGRYVFVSRQGKKVLELGLDDLAWAIKDGKLSVLNDGQLFDRALQTVIGDMRRRKQ
ncbi:DUF1631 family protein [Pseudoteredinibacter isoporae]|uniref:DUF1631 domain-containing protein n=1 Tax=Pseudoteredinibacter isoporae TaxID=570281 RepID=A0A7X0JWF4_9GAMM|nr:DUF1631 family protein [Pseudoteredinibacter isoporae]MBB6522760.1 hypothetical protein [Pseudoteredinibacter isoporae]NHO88288.1 DUF1631 domain-containing protein [Pseudoteredinibacter isoporae]NIB23381.1 DUF1631 domain-containing protein [Pseudoteredinibacter isoporae]